MHEALIRVEDDLSIGQHKICQMGDSLDVGLNFFIINLKKGEVIDLTNSFERACLLHKGDVVFSFDSDEKRAGRNCIFKEFPKTLHVAAGRSLRIRALDNSELFLIETKNEDDFSTMFFDEENSLDNEHRGKGILDDTSYRLVRTIFDKRNRVKSNLVLGEVITFPGRWSSYPPHHHTQPEIYHYRFSEPHGYGHAELGEEVLKVKHKDTIKILNQKDHAQVSAPGYAMYYLWAIKHLPNDPYTVPTFSKEHAWTISQEANNRVLKI